MMFLIPKFNLYDKFGARRKLFTKDQKYMVVDEVDSAFIIEDDGHFRNYITKEGKFITNFTAEWTYTESPKVG